MKKIIVVILILIVLVAAFIDWYSLLFVELPEDNSSKYTGLMSFEEYEPINLTFIPENVKNKPEPEKFVIKYGKKYEMREK